MFRSISRLLPGLALAAALAAMTAAAPAHDDDAREPRELRDFDRDLDRDRDSDRDRDRERGRDPVESDRSGRSASDREGRNGGDGNHEEDREDDRRGSNSGSNDSRDERRRTRIDVERNERGGDRQRDEVLLIGPPGTADAVRGAGYQILSERRMESLRQSLLRIQVRDSESIEQAIDTLRQRVPDVRAAPNHVFTPMGVNTPTAAHAALPPATAATGMSARIGIIDTGADTSLASLRSVVRSTRGFAPGGYVARPHGSAVAQLASSQGAILDVADVFGLDARQRLVAPADAIAAAIDWLLGEKLQVLNISIEGPRNDVLEFVISEALARGTAIVAAVGNGGPAAAPGYPAAYTGVIAVTALDENGVIYRRAARGQHVQFAAPGSFPGTGPPVVSSEPVSGTSFAAPLVAAELERRWRQRPGASLDQILVTLRAEARDLGKPGWDPIYGWGSIEVLRGKPAQ